MLSPASPCQSSKSRITKLHEVMERTGYSKSKIYRDMKTGRFPQQAKLIKGSRSAGWFEEDVDVFLEQRRPESSQYRGNSVPSSIARSDVAVSDVRHSDHNRIRSVAVLKAQTTRLGVDQTLMRTGMKINGAEVYCHVPTQKLLVVVGSISEEWLSAWKSHFDLDSDDHVRASIPRG